MDNVASELAVYLLERLNEQVPICVPRHIANALPINCVSIRITSTSRLCIGVSGAPGAGKVRSQPVGRQIVLIFVSRFKTTLSSLVTFHLNDKFKTSIPNADEEKEVAIVVPLDGWHLPRCALDTFPDPKLAHDRRGIHWTFDGDY